MLSQKLSGPIDGELITREFFPEYIGCEDEINKGECFHWAYIAEHLYNDVELWSNTCHAFVRQNGIFYDSESPKGTRSWRWLKCIKSIGMIWAKRYTWVEFQREWGQETNWLDCDKQLREFWKKRRQQNVKQRSTQTSEYRL